MAPQDSVGFVLVGTGSVGRGVFHQSLLTPQVQCRVLCDIQIERALGLTDPSRRSTVVSTEGELADALGRGELAVCEDARLAASAPRVDVLFDASTAVESAPGNIECAISAGKHIVMMNAEADALFGPWFWQLAQARGVAYTSSDGDQPAVIARLAEELRFYGLELAMVGNIKGFLDRYTDPVKIRPEAAKRGLDPQMCSSYTDGTKLCVEMSIVANALGGNVAQPGMRGPAMAEATDLFERFPLAELWSPGAPPVVDYILGSRPKGGVYVVGYTEDAYQRRMLDWFPPEVGPGPFYVLTRPYHLIHLETMRTVLEVGRTGRSLIAPRFGLRTEVVCYAKRPLAAGECLDGPGGFASYGLIENRADGSATGLPIVLSNGVRLRRAIARDERIGWDDIELSTVAPGALEGLRKASEITR
ncbi:MAG: homoserine dehydrogenase [Acidobacteriota bacterium]|nr:homoserine dehydrogenase [Acidobacteriota bacterium]